MELHPDFDFLPKPNHRADLNQFDEPIPPTLSNSVRKELMDLALRFREARPWDEVSGDDLFGIRDADSGALHLISVLGGNEDVFALHCHMPPEGIIFWQNALRGVQADMAPGLAEIRLLECDFMAESNATAEDLAFYKKYGKKKRNQPMVPCFRSYRPGFYPWFLEEEEAKRMIHVFTMFFRFYEEVLPNRGEHYQWENPFGEMPGIPVYHRENGEWIIKMEVLPSECLAPLRPRPEDATDFLELSGFPISDEIWEIGSFYMPTPVFDGNRPFYPKSAVCLRATDAGSRCPCDPIIYGGEGETDTEVIRQAFRDLVGHCQYMPSAIRVDSETSSAALDSYAERFEIELLTESQELMPLLVSEIVQSLEDSPPNWDEELLAHVVDAIPTEFQRTMAEEDMDKSVEAIAREVLTEKGFDSEALGSKPSPENIIFADFTTPRATGSSLD